MRIRVEPLRRTHVADCAKLLAARQRRERKLLPTLPDSFEDERAALAALKLVGARWATKGVVALGNAGLQGFLIGSLEPFASPDDHDARLGAGYVSVRAAGHAVNGTGGTSAYELYGQMYAALAPTWLAGGCRTHYVDVIAPDKAALDAWFSLGFGQEFVIAVRDTRRIPLMAGGANVDVRRAGASDVEAALHFVRSLEAYYLEAPMFYQAPAGSHAALRAVLAEGLGDRRRPVWLAWRDDRPLGMVSLSEAPVADPTATPVCSIHIDHCFSEPDARWLGVVLLRQALAWARDEGFEHCIAVWHAANLLSGRLCLALGFLPHQYRLRRVVDALPVHA